jgi:hypothetical protein
VEEGSVVPLETEETVLNFDYGVYGDNYNLSSRLFYECLHTLHPNERLIRISERQESHAHKQACETPFSVRSYEFEAGGEGGTWRQWICWCGEGTYVERISNGKV